MPVVAGYAGHEFLGLARLAIRPLGVIKPTAARRSYADSLAFEEVHVGVYRDHGFALVDIPPGPLTDWAHAAEAHILVIAGQ